MKMALDELSNSRRKLNDILGDKSTTYYNLMKEWFRMKRTKEEFFIEACLLFKREQLHYHNDFLLALFNKVDGLAQTSISIAQKEIFLPDRALVIGRFMLEAWKLGLEGADNEAADLIVVAVQNFLKNVISAVVSHRKGYKIRNKYFMYDIGGDTPTMYDRQCDGRIIVDGGPGALGPRCPPTIDKVKHSAAYEIACSISDAETKDEKLTIDEFYNTLLVQKNVIACHSVYVVNMERLALMINHPSH